MDNTNLLTEEEKIERMQALKHNVREEAQPYFSDEELMRILEEEQWNVAEASFVVLIRKAEDDSITLPSGLVMPNNQAYWLKLAKKYRQNESGTIRRRDTPWL